jgi:hypothetical protein
MASSLARAESRARLARAAVARQVDPRRARMQTVNFIAHGIDERRKGKAALAAAAANLARQMFHETGKAVAATNSMCAGKAMVAIAPVTGALASHAPDGGELDGLHRGNVAQPTRIKSRQ